MSRSRIIKALEMASISKSMWGAYVANHAEQSRGTCQYLLISQLTLQYMVQIAVHFKCKMRICKSRSLNAFPLYLMLSPPLCAPTSTFITNGTASFPSTTIFSKAIYACIAQQSNTVRVKVMTCWEQTVRNVTNGRTESSREK